MFGLFGKPARSARSARSKGEIRLGERDCHCHPIPGVDDGSRSPEESLSMLRLLIEAEVKTVVCTPHIHASRFPNEPDDLRRAFETLEHAREKAGLDVGLELGAEHYLDDTLAERIARNAVISFGPEHYVLFETGTGAHAPANLLEVCHDLRDRGYVPLLAHVERYRYLRGEEGRELCEDLRAAGVCFQVNRTVGKVNRPGVGARGVFISWLLEKGWVDEVGSDLHRPTRSGRPDETQS